MRILDRCAALTGAAYVLLVTVGNTLSTDNSPGPHPAHPTGQQNLDWLRWIAGSTSAQVGVTLELFGFVAWVLFVGYLCTRVRTGGWLAAAAFAGGAVAIAVKVASAGPILAAYVLRDDLGPETARVLGDLGGVAFVLDWLPTGVFVACAAGAALATRTVGRVLGWGGVAAGTGAVIVTAVTGVHVLGANPLPFLVCLLWILVVSIRLGAWRTAPDTPAPAADPVRVMV
ncbi:hypothetical protein [Frankia sp. Cr2]|uniref:hypothetical protein n=1 Tax=Frankia sp. Cr2 TaxID=3073932 RepID=UPI002AD21FA1|nr:hypothetical protein [Frankia sp. Cr2]